MANKDRCKNCGWEEQDHVNLVNLTDQKGWEAQEGAEVALVDCDGFESGEN